jgi:lysophospholipase L1-like esterase
MWFRILLALWSLVLVAILGYLGTHKSAEPAVLGRYSAGYFKVLVAVGLLAAAGVVVHGRRPYRWLYERRREIVLVFVSLVVSLVMAEVGVRLLDPLGVSYFEESSRYHFDKVADPALIYKHAPHLRRDYQGVEVATNELGLRERDVEKKRAGELRILLLGDSVTFGWGVPVEETFGRKLETLLTARLGRPVRTINAGVGSYNTVQEEAFLARFADLVDPDLVVLVYVSNDIEPASATFDPWSHRALRGKTPPQVLGLLLERSWLYRLGLFFSQYSRTKGPGTFDEKARGVKESMDALTAMAAFCRERGVGFVTFFYRPRAGSSAEDCSDLLSVVGSVAQKNGFPFDDIGQWWGEADMRSMTNSTIDSHLNARGHDVLAARMADFLVARGLADKAREVAR